MPVADHHLLGPYLDALLCRTPEAAAIVRREPREIPRRLRGLLLAIDGRHTARTYIERLRGFGDVEALLVELISLGLVQFQHRQARVATIEDAIAFEQAAGRSGAFTHSDLSPLGGWPADPRAMAHALADDTVRGPFDDLLRVAAADATRAGNGPMAESPLAPPPPPSAIEQQVESLFGLLEAVRTERKQLRERVVAMRKYRERARALQAQNQRLRRMVSGLSVLCGVLAAHALSVWL